MFVQSQYTYKVYTELLLHNPVGKTDRIIRVWYLYTTVFVFSLTISSQLITFWIYWGYYFPSPSPPVWSCYSFMVHLDSFVSLCIPFFISPQSEYWWNLDAWVSTENKRELSGLLKCQETCSTTDIIDGARECKLLKKKPANLYSLEIIHTIPEKMHPYWSFERPQRAWWRSSPV